MCVSVMKLYILSVLSLCNYMVSQPCVAWTWTQQTLVIIFLHPYNPSRNHTHALFEQIPTNWNWPSWRVFWWYFQNGNVSAFGPTRFVRACSTPKERKPPWQEALFLMRLEFLTNLRIASLGIWGLDTTTLTPRSARQSRIVAYLFYVPKM